jgi:nitrogen regulatory protein PII
MMKLVAWSLLFGAALFSARADLTIVQKVEGSGQNRDMIMKFKGDKMRIEVSPQFTTIVDTKTGEMINLINDQKTVMRMSGEKVKAAIEMAQQFADKSGKQERNEKPKLVSTGKKEIVNGYETEQYTYETPHYKATYWIAPKYPDGAAILKQLQTINPDVWKTANNQMPDYRDFPGLPVKTVVTMSGSEITSTLSAVKQDALSDADFTVPKDYQEMKLPDLSGLLQQNETPGQSPSPK